MYSKRLLLPYVGVVQVIDLSWGRALSIDGNNWAIRYKQNENKQTRHGRFSHHPRVNLSMIVTTDGDKPSTRVIRPNISATNIHMHSQQIFDLVSNNRVPFEAADCYEYWLLDNTDESPLALLHSCISEQDTHQPVPPSEWLSMPAAELDVVDIEASEQVSYQPPVNHRLQQSIEMRAGNKPKAVWFNRTVSESIDFPPCLIKEDWEDSDSQKCCDLYLQRLAPRLLMLDGISDAVRTRLEQAARQYAFDVEKFHPLYPDVVDQSFLNAALVEARLRHTTES